jgi:hypothetical protein
MTNVTHAELAADDGSALVGHILDATGAEARTVQDKLREIVSLLDFVPDTLHADIYDGSSTTDLSAYFDAALAYVESLPDGGEIYIPRGAYTMKMDLTKTSSDFAHRITLRGAGRGATLIKPTDTGDIVLNMLGRNVTTVRDLTIRAGDVYQAQCGIYLAREDDSPNANNNKFVNVTVEGNYSVACAVSLSAESSLWLDCRFAPNSGAATGFITGSDPSLVSVTVPAGTPVAGPNSDNRMIACEIYAPINNARLLVLSRAAAWVFSACGFIGGSASSVRLISYRDLDGGVFTGPVQFRDCQYEVFGAGNHIHYLDATGSSTWYGISSSGGYAVVDDNVPFLDYDRTGVSNQPLLGGCVLQMPEVPPGLTSGLPIYAFAFIDSRIDWRSRDINGVLVVLGFIARTPVDAQESRIAQIVNWDAPLYADAVPTAGTFAKGQRVFRSPGTSIAAGDAEGWICATSGTMGTLNGGATTANITNGSNQVSVNSASGLKVGQLISIAGIGARRVARISGTTVHLGSNSTATASGAAVSFSAGAFEPIGVIGLAQAAAQANSIATTVADLKTDFNALLAKLRTANVIDT